MGRSLFFLPTSTDLFLHSRTLSFYSPEKSCFIIRNDDGPFTGGGSDSRFSEDTLTRDFETIIAGTEDTSVKPKEGHLNYQHYAEFFADLGEPSSKVHEMMGHGNIRIIFGAVPSVKFIKEYPNPLKYFELVVRRLKIENTDRQIRIEYTIKETSRVLNLNLRDGVFHASGDIPDGRRPTGTAIPAVTTSFERRLTPSPLPAITAPEPPQDESHFQKAIGLLKRNPAGNPDKK